MSDGTKKLVVAVSLVAAVVGGILIISKLRAADDENPIRVRNKTLEFESEAAQGEWVTEGSTKYRLKKNKHPSAVFEVNAFGSSNCVTPLNGVTVEVQFELDAGAGIRTFTFTTADESGGNPKKEPIVDVGQVPMSADNSGYKKKLRPNPQLTGHITQVIVTSQAGAPTTCSFPAEPRVMVELCRQACP
jgi:hypothetical protein